MKIPLTILMTALGVFAVATAWVDYVQPQLNRAAGATVNKPVAVAEAVPIRKKFPKKPAPIESGLVPVPEDDETPTAKPTVSPLDASAGKLADRWDEVKAQESRLAARQETLRMIYDDIRAELATVDDLRKHATDELLEAEKRSVQAAPRKSAAPPLSARKSPPAVRSASESVANRSTAFILQRLADDGKMETAISMLKAMKQRDAAGVLESLEAADARLADRLATGIQSGRDETIRR